MSIGGDQTTFGGKPGGSWSNNNWFNPLQTVAAVCRVLEPGAWEGIGKGGGGAMAAAGPRTSRNPDPARSRRSGGTYPQAASSRMFPTGRGKLQLAVHARAMHRLGRRSAFTTRVEGCRRVLPVLRSIDCPRRNAARKKDGKAKLKRQERACDTNAQTTSPGTAPRCPSSFFADRFSRAPRRSCSFVPWRGAFGKPDTIALLPLSAAQR